MKHKKEKNMKDCFFNFFKTKGYMLFALPLIFSLSFSCVHKNPEVFREESINELQKELEGRVPEKVKSEQELTLDECIKIALQNNAQVKIAEIERKIARLEKNIAFSNFLPQVTSDFQVMSYDRAPKVSMGFISTSMQDKTTRIVDAQLQMPIFAPATWFIYDLRQKGVDVSNLVKDYTCQMIALQTTALFFQLSALENMEKSLQLQLDAANKLVEQMNHFYDEGLITQSQKEQTILLKQSKERDLAQCRDEIISTKAQLNTVLGISPLEKIKVAKDTPVPTIDKSLEDLILGALKSHPQIFLADQKILASEDEIRLAITNFLPVIGGFSQWQYTSSTKSLYSQSVVSGLQGILSLFSGFANINQYRIAKASRGKAFLEREDTSLSLMSGVVRAKSNWEQAKEDLKLAEQAFTYYKEKFREANEKWNEGMITEADIVSVQAELGTAEINLINAQIQEQLALASLWNSTGKTYMGNSIYYEPTKDTNNNKEKSANE